MVGDYMRAALRNIARRKLFGLISVLGLGAGYAIAMLIGIFLQFETSYDTMHADHDRMYRLNWVNVGAGSHFATFFNPVSPRIAAALPGEIEAVTRLANGQELLTIDGNSQYQAITFVDPNFFEFFDYGNVDGSAATAIQGARNAVVTRAAALHLFGTEQAMGMTFTLDGSEDFTVAAVIENNHTNSHLTSNIFVNMELLPLIWGWPNIWDSNGSDQLYHYVKLTPGTTPELAEERALEYVAANIFEDAADWLRIPFQPVTEVHFNTELQNEMTARDTITGAVKAPRRAGDLYIFAIVGLLTISIAAFNFMNLQIVQISNRLREVGVRKILGASRQQVVTQFMVETVLLSLLAMVVGVALAEVSLPFFGNLVGAELPAGRVFTPEIVVSLVITMTFVTLLAGTYPAVLAARLIPALALRGEVAQNIGPAKVRTGLVLLQFSMATGLIIASGVVGSQINYAFSKPLGFDATGVVSIFASQSISREAYPAMQLQLEQNPAIQSVSYANIVPSQDLFNGWSYSTNPDNPDETLSTRSVDMGYGAFEMLEMEMVAGRSFNSEFTADEAPEFASGLTQASAGLILNETAVRSAGWQDPSEAIGKQLVAMWNRNNTDYRIDFTVVGVVKDTHYRSIRSAIPPMSYLLRPSSRQMLVKIDPARETEALAAIDAAWQNHVTDTPIRRSMVADEYAAFYANENRTFSLIIGFAAVAAAIACLGLYGLTSYLVERRIKEVGIRKVLGATVSQIVTLLSWDYTKLVIVASLVIWPAVWWLMSDWLSSFAYRADLELSMFALASLAILTLAALTTSVRTLAAARANPINALRTE